MSNYLQTVRIDGDVHSSKNSRKVIVQRGRVLVLKSDAAKKDESTFAEQLAVQLEKWRDMTKGLQYPYYVKFCFFRGRLGRWDFANLVQGIADAMVKAGYIPDDDVDHFIPVYAGHELDRAAPGVEFWVSDL